MFKKRREIRELKMTIEVLKQVVNSLEDDIASLRAEVYKTAKKPTTRKKAK